MALDAPPEADADAMPAVSASVDDVEGDTGDDRETWSNDTAGRC